jgi:serine/threonine protein kinase
MSTTLTSDFGDFGPSVPCVFILQQFCNGGDLQQYVCKPMPTKTTEQLKERMRRLSKGEPEPPENLSRIRRLGFDEIFSFFRDISSGLNYLHSNGFIHRDLKPSNCLLHTSGKRRSVLVSDFGEVQMENAARKSTGATGTVSYCAPEVLQRVQPGGSFGNFTAKSDIFSLGMILYFMCFGGLPYVNADNINEENEDLDQLRAEITSWSGFDEERKLRSDLPDELYKYLKRLLSIDPASRPIAEEILKSIGMNESGGFDHGSHHSGPANLFPDIDSRSRISPVDTPSPAASGTASPMPESRFGSTRKKLSTSAISRPPRSTWSHTSPFPNDRRDPSPLAAERFSNRTQESGPNGNSLILRSQTHLPPQSTSNHQVTPMTPLQIRAPPINWLPTRLISSRSFRTLTRAIGSAYILNLSKAAILLFKIFSLNKPCSPAATNTWISYPLLCLAAWDISVAPSRIRRTLLLIIVHMVIILLAKWSNCLCAYHSNPVLWNPL